MGADSLGPSQGVPRGGRFVHPVGPGSGFLGMDGWGQQSHDRQIGFHGTPHEGHHAYPVGPSSGHTNMQLGFPQWAPQDWHPANPVGPGSGHSGMQGWGHEFQGVSRQRVRPYERPGTGGVGGGYQGRGVQRGPYYSGGPSAGPNYRNRGGSGGASRSGGPSVVSGRRGTAVVPGAVVAPLRLVP